LSVQGIRTVCSGEHPVFQRVLSVFLTLCPPMALSAMGGLTTPD
jgi:hypothetical protein